MDRGIHQTMQQNNNNYQRTDLILISAAISQTNVKSEIIRLRGRPLISPDGRIRLMNNYSYTKTRDLLLKIFEKKPDQLQVILNELHLAMKSKTKIQRNVISKRTRMNVIRSGLIQLNRFKKCSKTFVLKNDYNFIDFNQFFDYGFEMIVCKLKKMTQQTSIKFNLYLDCVYVHVLTQEYRDISFKTVNVLAYTNSNFENLLKKMFDKINKEESNFVTKGSGWSLYSIDALQLRINIVNSLTGSSYVILPECIRNKKAVINVKNNDNKCFKYAILTKYNTRSDKTKFSNQYFKILEKKSRLNFHCIDFPTPVNQIKSFERLNNVSVNVFSLDNKNVVFPLYMNNVESKNHFDLLLINNGITSHYCFINDFCRLIRNQKTKHKSKLIICKRCFTVFSNIPCKFKLWGIDGLKKHKKICGKHKLGRPVMFDNGDDDTIYFKNFKRSQRIPIVIYSDFECYLKPIINNQDIKTKTLITHKHKPMSYAFYVKIDYDIIPKYLIKNIKFQQNFMFIEIVMQQNIS
ncbi:uncharacterized protein LOC126555790 [Aphis gossypii]|uniref:uncharacterized protein LOC126555790 n=1 Tax=Aphis gossypii TaxID=80765 RepID=UPI002158A44A|nr:uncharacterized protein LOC126555790 [Aphis gossypii]